MKKFFALLMTLLLLLTACSEEAVMEIEKSAEPWGISLSVKDVTASGLTLIINQSGGEPSGSLEFGSDYQLYVRKGNSWQPVPYAIDGDIIWTAEAYMVNTGGSTEQLLKWDHLYGELRPGTYGILKSFLDFRGTGDYDEGDCWVEFDIE